ncbi:flagellar motor protein MotB [Nitratiruptor sp. YY09-18]|uniref:OmpA/MotB family protein n=1 Tax=Nitratiruptor sp. YY09-18 TaxID=2724901 RepID=UPI0019158B39|nr:flagellar motor protein MotB [Nitratiruptor sp. YY09-18]BCD68097.1 chemotaxis protein MotB [Nitratiruptor sp. YY09-18]
MARKKEQECPSIPGWLVSFGDLMSLLLTFFILLYAMSTVDVTKALKFLSYFQGEPNFKQLKINVVPPIVPFSTDVVTKIKKRIKKILPSHAFQMSVTSKYALVRLFNDIMFEDDGYTLTPKAKEALNQIAQVLKNIQNKQKFHIKVVGHAFIEDPENLPPDVQDAWDLSIKRAEAVAMYLMQKGVDPAKFYLTGYGDTKPLYTWNNPMLKRRNNRVEIYIEVEKKVAP